MNYDENEFISENRYEKSDGYEKLKAAIVKQAFDDMITASNELKRLRAKQKNDEINYKIKKAEGEIYAIKKWFNSNWANHITSGGAQSIYERWMREELKDD